MPSSTFTLQGDIPINLKDTLTAQEYESILQRSDLHGWWFVFCNYVITAALFALMAIWTNPLTILLGVILLGGRQLGFGVIVHECGHGTMFNSRKLNDFVGEWLAAPTTFNNMKAYARGHLAHHKLAGTREDPDLPNYQDYPITRSRLRRKLWRDFSGQTGWKQTQGIFRSFARFNDLSSEARLALIRGLVFNLLLLGLLTATGTPWLYIVWWAAMLTSNRVVARLRQVAEHANVPDLYDMDPRRNTRTVPAGWFDRLVFCPMGVNYHLEHHILASVPVYNLPMLHRLLMQKGCYDGVDFPTSYFSMLRGVTTSG